MGYSKMMQHYLELKEQHKDKIIFYRLGDFYEMFFDDAVKASKLLDLTLTGRDCGVEERAPMCGVPFHSAEMYIDKLVQLGEKVAICEQLSDPNGKDLVKRDIVRVVTRGTVTNEEFIDEKSNNFLVSVYSNSSSISASWVDITTGEFFAKTLDSENKIADLFNLLVKISPAEIICNELSFDILVASPLVVQGIMPKPQLYIESEYDYFSASKSLKEQLNTVNLSLIFDNENNPAINSSGALISYLKETQKNSLSNINKICFENQTKTLMLDSNAVRNLELLKTNRDQKRYGSLLWVLDKTKTSMGARKLQSYILSPLNDLDQINSRLDSVEAFVNNTIVRTTLTDTLASVNDIGRITGKISNGTIMPKDCIALCKSLEVLPSIKFNLLGIQAELISNIASSINDYSSLINLLNASIIDSVKEEKLRERNVFKYIKPGFNEELDELRDLCTNSVKVLRDLEAKEREKTGIKTLKIGFNRVFGYYIEVTNSFKEKIPYEYVRRQTLANAERYITDELKELENKILSAEDRAIQLELRLFNEIKSELSNNISSLQKTADLIAELDILLCFANVSKEYNYVRPNVLDYNNDLKIVDGRHPVVEANSKVRFIPNDCLLNSNDSRTMIITGPNMAGKSTYMRQIALIAIMAHMGCFVPAKSADIPLIDKIFTRIGASDSLISDQSTFMVEMSETADIIKNATDKSLIILDEIGRGTSTFDGLSIAWAVLEFVTENIKAKTLFATHYHELTEIEDKINGVKNFKVTVKEFNGSIIFMRKIMRGRANRSFGIEVAELAGVDKEVTLRAKSILKMLEDSDLLNNAKEFENSNEKSYSEVEAIIKDLDIDNLSPMQAFNVLVDLKEKIKD